MVLGVMYLVVSSWACFSFGDGSSFGLSYHVDLDCNEWHLETDQELLLG